MKTLRFILVFLVVLITVPGMSAGVATCTGKFPNPITDICWSCILPISIGSATVANFGGQEDIPNPSSPVCTCGVNPTIGLSVGFWEPSWFRCWPTRRLAVSATPQGWVCPSRC